MKRLLERRRRLMRGLPPFEEVLRGSVVHRLLRCGKPGCRCARGEGHPAAYLSVTLAGGRTEQNAAVTVGGSAMDIGQALHAA
jgi:hypothetical protein